MKGRGSPFACQSQLRKPAHRIGKPPTPTGDHWSNTLSPGFAHHADRRLRRRFVAAPSWNLPRPRPPAPRLVTRCGHWLDGSCVCPKRSTTSKLRSPPPSPPAIRRGGLLSSRSRDCRGPAHRRGRLHSAASFAALCRASPFQTSSGKPNVTGSIDSRRSPCGRGFHGLGHKTLALACRSRQRPIVVGVAIPSASRPTPAQCQRPTGGPAVRRTACPARRAGALGAPALSDRGPPQWSNRSKYWFRVTEPAIRATIRTWWCLARSRTVLVRAVTAMSSARSRAYFPHPSPGAGLPLAPARVIRRTCPWHFLPVQADQGCGVGLQVATARTAP
ncbi:hypothetical protein BJY14_000765 [Actinomadura luteofluorescens]|uniref:Uncharacterized protein n=1 Tax=Actinomadura luteofluorescens TaxID=46163 RepID=A0A7Y9JD87_9ACTN|nr:hypothetical protein [Actinomadura luteofluorescens]